MTRISEPTALVVVCVGASLAAVALCYWLWDGWIAAFFALLSLDWFQRSLLGGAEPLFMAFLLGSFVALRRERWVCAAVLGSLATVVRPFGVFALVGVGVHLLSRKRFSDCAIVTAIAWELERLYTWPLKHYLGNPFANIASYQANDWHGGLPFNFPFVDIVRDLIRTSAPLTNLALTLSWMLFVLVAMPGRDSHRRIPALREDPHRRGVFCALILPCAFYLQRSRLVAVPVSTICCSHAALGRVFSQAIRCPGIAWWCGLSP